MSLLTFAIQTNRWDLAAYAIVLVTLKIIADGEKTDAGEQDPKQETETKLISPAG